MKKILLVSLISVFATTFILPAFSAPEESIQVLVTSTLISVSLSPSTVDFGTLNADEEEVAAEAPVATNDGSVAIVLDMKGTNATYGANTWALNDTSNGADQYMLMVSRDSDWESEVLNLNTGYQEFYYTPLAPGVGQGFMVKILMPETISGPGEYTAQIYVLATQP